MRLARQLLLAVLIGAPPGLILAFLATPLLWRLEDPLGMGLAGHSGPSEWILWTSVAALSLTALAVLRHIQKN
jgi:hypothetical protein